MNKHFEIQIVDENGTPLQFYRPSKAKREAIKKAAREGGNVDLSEFKTNKIPDKRFDKFVQFRNDGFSLEQIANIYDISPERVRRILKDGGYGN